MKDREIIEVVQAFLDGKEIECHYYRDPLDKWAFCKQPLWNFNDFDYRVKKIEKIMYGNIYPTHITLRNTIEEAQKNVNKCKVEKECVKFLLKEID